MGKASKRSRQCTRDALRQLEKIEKEFPDIQSTKGKEALLESRLLKLGEAIVQSRYRGFSFYDKFRRIRNSIAHSTKDFSQEDIATLNEVLELFPSIKIELQKNLETDFSSEPTVRRFEKFNSHVGSSLDRKQLVDAIEDTLSVELLEEKKTFFPDNNFAIQAKQILTPQNENDKNAIIFVKDHEGLQKSILKDIVGWIEKTSFDLTKKNPFLQEEIFIKKTKAMSISDVSKNIKKLASEYKNLPSIHETTRGSISSANMDFDFYIKQLSSSVEKTNTKDKDKLKKLTDNNAEALVRNLNNDLEQNFVNRRNLWELGQIEKKRKEFIAELYKRIEQFKKLEKQISPFINDLGYLWDMSNKPFADSGFEILAQFSDLLEKEESLQKLASLLGRQSREQKTFEKELREKIKVTTEFHPHSAYRGQISGLKLSNDISTVIPSELALNKNPVTKLYFAYKFAHKQLLSYKYEKEFATRKEQKIQEKIEVAQIESKGPILICVDTSGSMHGTPERIAKTITFALTKIAIKEKRNCYLISFSTKIEILDLSSFKNSDALIKLVQFLRMSFHGGTDANPALNHAIALLQNKKWKNADVLMVSDFIMNNLPIETINAIELEKEKKTKFYSLAIGDSGNNSTIKSFSENWSYNINEHNAQQQLVRQLNSLKNI